MLGVEFDMDFRLSQGRSGAATSTNEVRYQPGDTLILPSAQVHQIFSGTAGEFVTAMSIGGTVKLPVGMEIGLPWRK
jgi:hypothetical protein